MDLVSVQISERLWVQGCRNVTMAGHPDWTFYYSLSGGESSPHRSWVLLFFHCDLCVVRLRSPIIDLSLQGAYVQQKVYHSNIYCLSMEQIWNEVSPWSPPQSCLDTADAQDEVQGDELTYTCTPPVLIKDSFGCNGTTGGDKKSIKLRQTQGGGFFAKFIDDEQPTTTTNNNNHLLWTVCGYLSYNGQDQQHRRRHHHHLSRRHHHREAEDAHRTKHHPMTWIPTLLVNTATLECKFIISFTDRRDRNRCIQCLADVVDEGGLSVEQGGGGVDVKNLNDQLSQMMLIH